MLHTGTFGKSAKGKSILGSALAMCAGLFGFGSKPEKKAFQTISIPLTSEDGRFDRSYGKTRKYTRCELYGKKKGHSRGRSNFKPCL